MSQQYSDLGTQVRNAVRALIYPFYLSAQDDAEGWGKLSHEHSGRIHAYSTAVGLLDQGKSLEDVRTAMKSGITEIESTLWRDFDLYPPMDDYSEDYLSAAKHVVGILDGILGVK